MPVNDKEMSSIQQSIPFQEQNELDVILVEFRFYNITIGFGSHPSTLLIGEPRLVHVSAFMNVIIFQEKQKRIEVADKNIEGINLIESTPEEHEKTKVTRKPVGFMQSCVLIKCGL